MSTPSSWSLGDFATAPHPTLPKSLVLNGTRPKNDRNMKSVFDCSYTYQEFPETSTTGITSRNGYRYIGYTKNRQTTGWVCQVTGCDVRIHVDMKSRKVMRYSNWHCHDPVLEENPKYLWNYFYEIPEPQFQQIMGKSFGFIKLDKKAENVQKMGNKKLPTPSEFLILPSFYSNVMNVKQAPGQNSTIVPESGSRKLNLTPVNFVSQASFANNKLPEGSNTSNFVSSEIVPCFRSSSRLKSENQSFTLRGVANREQYRFTDFVYDGKNMSWVCCVSDCEARIHTNTSTRMISRTFKKHNHKPNMDENPMHKLDQIYPINTKLFSQLAGYEVPEVGEILEQSSGNANTRMMNRLILQKLRIVISANKNRDNIVRNAIEQLPRAGSTPDDSAPMVSHPKTLIEQVGMKIPPPTAPNVKTNNTIGSPIIGTLHGYQYQFVGVMQLTERLLWKCCSPMCETSVITDVQEYLLIKMSKEHNHAPVFEQRKYGQMNVCDSRHSKELWKIIGAQQKSKLSEMTVCCGPAPKKARLVDQIVPYRANSNQVSSKVLSAKDFLLKQYVSKVKF